MEPCLSEEKKRPPPTEAPIPTGRLRRLSRLTGAATAATARHALQKLREVITPPGEQEAQRASVVRRTAQDVVNVLAELKGAALKVGQLMSLEPQLLPQDLREALTHLQRTVPAMPYAQVQKVIQEAFGEPVDKVFASFDPEPMGAASIGQVHRATAPDGTALAVKVQYPGVADSIDSDVDNLASVLRVARMVTSGVPLEEYLEGLRKTLKRETDYQAEADNLVRYGQRFTVFPWVRVPRAFPELTRRTVLSMERMEGRQLDEHVREVDPARRDEIVGRWVEFFMRSMHELHTLHADPHPGNFMVDAEGRLVLLDFGCMCDFDPHFPNGLLDILRAQWRGEAERLPALFNGLGFGGGKAAPVDGEALYEWLEILLEPLLKDAAFDFGNWDLESRAARFVLDHPALMTFTPPKPALFYFRVCMGVRGILARTGARVNVYRQVRDLDQRLRRTSSP